MRFLIQWEWTESTSDEEQAKALATFAAWTPPIELSDWSGFGDSNGGFAIAETDKWKKISSGPQRKSPPAPARARPRPPQPARARPSPPEPITGVVQMDSIFIIIIKTELLKRIY